MLSEIAQNLKGCAWIQRFAAGLCHNSIKVLDSHWLNWRTFYCWAVLKLTTSIV